MLRWVTIAARPRKKWPSETASAGLIAVAAGSDTPSTTQKHRTTTTAASSTDTAGATRSPEPSLASSSRPRSRVIRIGTKRTLVTKAVPAQARSSCEPTVVPRVRKMPTSTSDWSA